MTPIKCFRRQALALYVEDWAGIRKLICVAVNEEERTWLEWSLEKVHNVKFYDWDEEYK